MVASFRRGYVAKGGLRAGVPELAGVARLSVRLHARRDHTHFAPWSLR